MLSRIAVEHLLQPLVQRKNQIAIRTRQQAGKHFHHGHARSQRGIDRPSSNPMYPPPTTSRVPGMSSRFSAPVESIMRGDFELQSSEQSQAASLSR